MTNFDATWRFACRVERASRSDVDHIVKRHYIGKWPGVVTLILAMIHSGSVVGACIFALPPRETSIRYKGNTWELARLWIDDCAPRNAETWFLARAVRFIRKHHADVKVLVSYADPSAGHSGVIYKAANWVSDGRTDQERKTPRFDYACAKTGKRYSRRCHVPPGITIIRIPRVSKHRFILRIDS